MAALNIGKRPAVEKIQRFAADITVMMILGSTATIALVAFIAGRIRNTNVLSS